MPLDIDSALGIHAAALKLRARRAQLLASNLANIDTPNFKARDFDFRAALEHARQGRESDAAMQLSHVRHIAPAGGAGAVDMLYRVPMQSSLDGNTVDASLEQGAFAENAVQYRASLQFLSGRLRSLLTAIRGE